MQGEGGTPSRRLAPHRPHQRSAQERRGPGGRRGRRLTRVCNSGRQFCAIWDRRQHEAAGPAGGTIPARAGETSPCRRSTTPRRDHPRARGGDVGRRVEGNFEQGPSPRARGRQKTGSHQHLRAGTIPARAGETSRAGSRAPRPWDHPRARGGDVRSSTSVVDVGGPSPRARGRRGRVRPCLRRGGTIPARAGETRSLRALKRIPWDHPRARGGDPATISASRFFQGPSPRARGRPAHADIPLRVGGTIPARAGETSPRSSSARRRRDHPRARGGDPGRKRRPSWSSGPCPRARGRPSTPIALDDLSVVFD